MPKQAKGGGIHRWPESERPRERLFREGPETLSDAQLLAILLRVGRPEASAVQVAMELLQHLDGLQGIANRGLGELCGVRGVGLAKAAQLKAALELGKRALTTPLSTGTRIGSSRDLFHYYYPRLRDLRHEVFKIILLDAKHALIRDATVSEGSLTLSIVHPREVFNLAVRESAAAVIFLHNHPSGDPQPSSEDRALTARLVAAGEVLGIRVLDHLIVGDGRYISFADQGWLEPDRRAASCPTEETGEMIRTPPTRAPQAGHARSQKKRGPATIRPRNDLPGP